MKKLFIMMAALFAGVSMSAQMKGDMSMYGNLGINSGNVVSTASAGGVTTTVKAPKGIDFSIGAGFGYFVADNLEVSLGLRYGLYRIQNNWEDVTATKKFYDMTNSFTIAPQLKYYVSIVDDVFYYTPSLKIGFTIEGGKSQIDENTTEKYSYTLSYNGEQISPIGYNSPTTFAIGLDLVSFEFKPSYNIGVNFSLGGIFYENVSYKYEEDGVVAKASDNTFSFGFDSVLTPTIGVKFYFF